MVFKPHFKTRFFTPKSPTNGKNLLISHIMMHENLPTDPFMLLSFINMKLRDYHYDSLEALCKDLDIECDELIEKLHVAGFEYNPEQKKFW